MDALFCRFHDIERNVSGFFTMRDPDAFRCIIKQSGVPHLVVIEKAFGMHADKTGAFQGLNKICSGCRCGVVLQMRGLCGIVYKNIVKKTERSAL